MMFVKKPWHVWKIGCPYLKGPGFSAVHVHCIFIVLQKLTSSVKQDYQLQEVLSTQCQVFFKKVQKISASWRFEHIKDGKLVKYQRYVPLPRDWWILSCEEAQWQFHPENCLPNDRSSLVVDDFVHVAHVEVAQGGVTPLSIRSLFTCWFEDVGRHGRNRANIVAKAHGHFATSNLHGNCNEHVTALLFFASVMMMASEDTLSWNRILSEMKCGV